MAHFFEVKYREIGVHNRLRGHDLLASVPGTPAQRVAGDAEANAVILDNLVAGVLQQRARYPHLAEPGIAVRWRQATHYLWLHLERECEGSLASWIRLGSRRAVNKPER